MSRNRPREEAPPTTYLAFSELEEPLPAGRFANVEPRHVVGRAPREDVPRQPSDSPWHADPVPDEPSLGIAIDAPIDIGWPSPPQSSPPSSTAAGEEASSVPVDNLPTVEARTLPKFQRRKP
jgi:hypothetical protein